MNISKYLTTILLLTSLITCSKNQNDIAIREIGSQVNLFGFKNSTYTIGQKIKSVSDIDTSNLHLKITEGILMSISISNNTNYELTNGVRIGNTKSEIIGIMGRPIRDEIKFNKGTRQIGSIDALVYNKAIIIFDKNKLASSITLETVE